MPNKYTSEYFFERLKQIRQVMKKLEKYKPLKEIMATKEMTIDMSCVNIRQGLEK